LPEVHTYSDDYLLVYAMRGTIDVPTQQAITSFARKKGLRTVAVWYRHDWVDENHSNANPFEWIGRIRCARCMYTGMFHGTIFALKMGKTFATSYSAHVESKIRPMLEALNLQDRVCDAPEKLANILESRWSVESTHQQMAVMASGVRKYLERALA